MTVNPSEINLENNLAQEKIDVNTTQKANTEQIAPNNAQESNKEADSTHEDPNWRAVREARKKERAEREAAERKAAEKQLEIEALKAAMEAAFSKSSSPQQQYYSDQNQYGHEETEDERIEKKVQAALAAREAQAEQARIKREQQEYPERLRQAYGDFNQTVSPENLDYLDYHYPEVSRPLQRLQEGFDKWSDIYRAVKKFVPNNTTAKKDAAKADANFAKPKSISSSSITQPGEAASSARLTEERRAANWERMQKLLKSVG
jgi:hypothetical protein